MKSLTLTFFLLILTQFNTVQANESYELPQSEIEEKGWGAPPPWKWGKLNTHLVDQDVRTGFEIYRTSRPSRQDMRTLCKLGITEMMVLSGTAERHELRYAEECPTLKVIYNEPQNTTTPVSSKFLRAFDAWVEGARHDGKKIAFRCECGCHRTGRLAAYYHMKHQGVSLEQATADLTRYGQWMIFYPHIYKQVQALHDYVQGRACSTRRKHCVREEDSGLAYEFGLN